VVIVRSTVSARISNSGSLSTLLPARRYIGYAATCKRIWAAKAAQPKRKLRMGLQELGPVLLEAQKLTLLARRGIHPPSLLRPAPAGSAAPVADRCSAVSLWCLRCARVPSSHSLRLLASFAAHPAHAPPPPLPLPRFTRRRRRRRRGWRPPTSSGPTRSTPGRSSAPRPSPTPWSTSAPSSRVLFPALSSPRLSPDALLGSPLRHLLASTPLLQEH
jgi:hypothetical protein